MFKYVQQNGLKEEREKKIKRAKSSSQYWLMIVADDTPGPPSDEAITCLV
jgi:hypothetical protein